jgi:single-strand DNA-binding protein
MALAVPADTGKDAVLRTTRNQTPFAGFTLATHRSWKDRNSGERQSVAEWHRCVVFGKLANYAGTLTKGTHVQLEGEIRTRQYTPRVLAESAGGVKNPSLRSVCSAS